MFKKQQTRKENRLRGEYLSAKRKLFISKCLQWPGFFGYLAGIMMIAWAFRATPIEHVKAIFGFIFLFVGGGAFMTSLFLVEKQPNKVWHELSGVFGVAAFFISIFYVAVGFNNKFDGTGDFGGPGFWPMTATTIIFTLVFFLVRKMKKDFGDLSFANALKSLWLDIKSDKDQ